MYKEMPMPQPIASNDAAVYCSYLANLTFLTSNNAPFSLIFACLCVLAQELPHINDNKIHLVIIIGSTLARGTIGLLTSREPSRMRPRSTVHLARGNDLSCSFGSQLARKCYPIQVLDDAIYNLHSSSKALLFGITHTNRRAIVSRCWLPCTLNSATRVPSSKESLARHCFLLQYSRFHSTNGRHRLTTSNGC